MKQLICVLLIITISFLFIGCATIFSGSKEEVSLSSEPKGASIFINGMNRGKAPIMLSLKKGREYNIEFKMDGYETKVWHISYSLGAGWVILDIFTLGIGIIVDAITGAWNGLDDDSYKAILEPAK